MHKWNDQSNSNYYNNVRYNNLNNYYPPKNTFFSQFSQDISLENCIFKGFKNGFFMDVGAHDGVDHNNTLYFETNNNWRGVNIEPIKNIFNRLKTNRPNSININCAISERNGQSKFLLNHGHTEMLSGLSEHIDPRHRTRINYENNHTNSYSEEIIIETRTIKDICLEYDIKRIHYLSVDVEGAELSVLKSIDYENVFIDVIEFENNYQDTADEVVKFLKEKGYVKLPYHNADIFMIHRNSEFLDNIFS